VKLKDVISFAKSKGYETASFLNKWRGYDVYEPIMSEDIVTDTGPPLVILVKDNRARISTPDEALEHLDETA